VHVSHCPNCKKPGRKVKTVTLANLLRPERHPAIGDRRYYVCATAECDTVYFNGESRFGKADLVVRFGLKETTAPRPVCYCFGHTIEEIHGEIARTGQSTVLDSIKADMKDPGCGCEQTNPLGACCLGTVKAVVEEGFRLTGKPATVVDVSGDCFADDCCAPQSSDGSGALAVGGSMVAAALSSACCWLPLVLLAFGASAAGVAGFFEQWRVPFIAVAAVLLSSGFYFQYWRRPKCPDGSCAAPSKRLRILNRSMLWVATAFVVAMILFPNYVQHLIGGSDAIAVADTPSEGIGLVVPVEGMTCEGCASILTNALGKVAGVWAVDVSYADKHALVTISPDDEAVRAQIVDVVTSAGYKTRLEDIREHP
jgi:copper chaperone CopZ